MCVEHFGKRQKQARLGLGNIMGPGLLGLQRVIVLLLRTIIIQNDIQIMGAADLNVNKWVSIAVAAADVALDLF
jgi:hypothetical protein